MAEARTVSTARVLVADSVSSRGVELLRAAPGFEVEVRTGLAPAELARALAEHDALIVRSATKVTAEVLREPGRLRVIGRAGTGVDNIDLDAATRAGIVVLNTPGGNSVAAAELTLALLLALARNVPQANADLRAGTWERKRWVGTEVSGKTLGVLGLGRIGREVARRALAFRMEVLGYDPYVSQRACEDMGLRAAELDELLAASDFLTLHLPLSDETRHMIDAGALGRMKAGARLVNCARGGLVDETALLAALESGRLAGAALDVFEEEPPRDTALLEHPAVVSTPHLGASTLEAQERVGVEIAEKIRAYLEHGEISDAVNFPSLAPEMRAEMAPLFELARAMGSFVAQIVEGGVRSFEVGVLGRLAERPLRPIVLSAVHGMLVPMVEGGTVTPVNALALAGERGITVEERRSNETSPYAGLLRLTLVTDRGRATVAGTLFGDDRPRIVEIDGVSIETHPAGQLLFIRNRDVPGVVGKLGTILGRAGVNIAGIQLGRPQGGEHAVSIINVDSAVPREALEAIRAIEEIVTARAIVV